MSKKSVGCPHCGSPWEVDEIGEMGEYIGTPISFEDAVEAFWEKGCAAFGVGHAGSYREILERQWEKLAEDPSRADRISSAL